MTDPTRQASDEPDPTQQTPDNTNESDPTQTPDQLDLDILPDMTLDTPEEVDAPIMSIDPYKITMLDESLGIDFDKCHLERCDHCIYCEVESCPECKNCVECKILYDKYLENIKICMKNRCEHFEQLSAQGYSLDMLDKIMYDRTKLTYKRETGPLDLDEQKQLYELNKAYSNYQYPPDDRKIGEIDPRLILSYDELREKNILDIYVCFHLVQTYDRIKYIITLDFTDDMENPEETIDIYHKFTSTMKSLNIPYQEYKTCPDNISQGFKRIRDGVEYPPFITLHIQNQYKTNDVAFVNILTAIYNSFMDEQDLTLGCCPHEISQELKDKFITLGYIINSERISQDVASARTDNQSDRSSEDADNCNEQCLICTVSLKP